MPGITKEQISQARGANLIDYFRRSGYELKRHGDVLYVKEIPSLCIRESTGAWYYHYEQTGGNNSVNCLTQILGKNFMTAVEELSDGSIGTKAEAVHGVSAAPPKPKSDKIRHDFVTPERMPHMKDVYAYLIKTRCIPRETVDEFVHKGLLYQGEKGNAIFVHKNENGEITGAEVQGTNSIKQFRGVAAGTENSVLKFAVGCKPGEAKRAYAFESAIDLMSFYAMSDKAKIQGAVLVSMAGLKPTALREMQNQGVKIFACADNDKKGKEFCEKHNFQSISGILAGRGVKDWNELLQNVRAGTMKPPSARQEKFVEADVKTSREPREFLTESKTSPELFAAEKLQIMREGMRDILAAGNPVAIEKLHAVNDFVNNYEVKSDALKAVSDFQIRFDNIPINGLCKRNTREIIIKKDLSEVQTLQSIIHEIAHSKQSDKIFNDESRAEIHAEAVSNIVSSFLEADTSDTSFSYAANYVNGADLKEFESVADDIQKSSTELIAALDRKMKELASERGIDLKSKATGYSYADGTAVMNKDFTKEIKEILAAFADKHGTVGELKIYSVPFESREYGGVIMSVNLKEKLPDGSEIKYGEIGKRNVGDRLSADMAECFLEQSEKNLAEKMSGAENSQSEKSAPQTSEQEEVYEYRRGGR